MHDYLIVKKEFLILLVQIYQDVIKVTVNIIVTPCLQFLNLGKEAVTYKNQSRLAGMMSLNQHEFRNQEEQL